MLIFVSAVNYCQPIFLVQIVVGEKKKTQTTGMYLILDCHREFLLFRYKHQAFFTLHHKQQIEQEKVLGCHEKRILTFWVGLTLESLGKTVGFLHRKSSQREIKYLL